jgi:hypothetical protein
VYVKMALGFAVTLGISLVSLGMYRPRVGEKLSGTGDILSESLGYLIRVPGIIYPSPSRSPSRSRSRSRSQY